MIDAPPRRLTTTLAVVYPGGRVIGFPRTLSDGLLNGHVSKAVIFEDGRGWGVGCVLCRRQQASSARWPW